MPRSFLLALTTAILAVSLTAARGPDDDKGSKDKPADQPPELRFADSSAVRLALLQDQIEVQTRYGKLVVPLAEVRSIEFALRIPAETTKRIDTASANLASDDFKTREKASAELLALRELAWPTVLTLTKSSDKEVARRAAELQEKLQSLLTEEQRNMRLFDVVRTDAFTIQGTIVGTGLKARSPYFGEVEVQLATLRHYRRMRGNDLDREVVVDAAKFGLQNPTWLDTGIDLDGETAIVIQATGEIDLQGGNGQFKSGPSGNGQFGGGFRGNGGVFLPGALVGRIGEKGREFLIGDHHEAKPADRGKLYLRVICGPWGNQLVGEYKVKIAGR
jgi:hypothetical protein